MKKGYRKCVQCGVIGKHKYKKGKKRFCSKEHKEEYFENDIPTLKKEIQIEFNKFVAKGKPCAWCGRRYDVMHCSHILSRGSSDHLRYDIFNVLPMCARCHKWNWHDNPLVAMEWFTNRYAQRYDYLLFAKGQFKKWTTEELREIRQAIQGKEPKKLIRFRKEWQKY